MTDTLKVYQKPNPLPFHLVIGLVVADTQIRDPFRSEYYVFVVDRENYFLGQQTNLGKTPIHLREYQLEHLFPDAFQAMSSGYNHFIHQKFQGDERRAALQLDRQFRELPEQKGFRDLAGLWRRDEFTQQFRMIWDQTQFRSIKQLLDGLLALPQLRPSGKVVHNTWQGLP